MDMTYDVMSIDWTKGSAQPDGPSTAKLRRECRTHSGKKASSLQATFKQIIPGKAGQEETARYHASIVQDSKTVPKKAAPKQTAGVK